MRRSERIGCQREYRRYGRRYSSCGSRAGSSLAFAWMEAAEGRIPHVRQIDTITLTAQ